jgi:hypothetical protein
MDSITADNIRRLGTDLRHTRDRISDVDGRDNAPSMGLRLKRSPSAPTEWELRGLHWELPEWLDWYTYGFMVTIPVADSTGVIYIQLCTTPLSNIISHLPWGYGKIRLMADVDGALPQVHSAVTFTGRRIDYPLSPLLWIPVARFTGHANGDLSFDYIGMCRNSLCPFTVWSSWLVGAFSIVHGTAGGSVEIRTQSRPHWLANYVAGHTTIIVSPPFNEAGFVAVPTSPAGRTALTYLYCDTINLALTEDGTFADLTNKNMCVLGYTHDGYGNILDLALGGAPLGQWHT